MSADKADKTLRVGQHVHHKSSNFNAVGVDDFLEKRDRHASLPHYNIVIVAEEDSACFKALKQLSRLELTHIAPEDFLECDFTGYDQNCDAIVIDLETSLFHTRLELTSPIIFVASEARLEQQKRFAYSPAYYVLSTEMATPVFTFSLMIKMSEQLAIAVKDADLHEQVLTDLHQKEALYSISQMLRSTENLEESLEGVWEILAKALDARWLIKDSVKSATDIVEPIPFVVDYKTNELFRNIPMQEVIVHASRRALAYPLVYSASYPLAYRCISTRTVQCFKKNDLKTLNREEQKIVEALNLGSLLLVPIFDIHDENVLTGVLTVARESHQDDFTEADLNFLVSVSHQMTMAQSQKALLKKVEYQAFHDVLTGLPNRRFFNEHLRQEFITAKRTNRRVALLFVDLDDFKSINDTFSHDIGDKLIKAVAERLQYRTRQVDILARLGCDEFVVVLFDVDSLDTSINIAAEYIDSFQIPFNLEGQTMRITASIGVSMFPDDGDTKEALLKHADIAMCIAKTQGKNGVQMFSQDFADRARARLRLEDNLRFAVANQEFLLHYQPQYCLHSGDLLGVEALIRWNQNGKALLSPDQFIVVAEETLLIIEIGEWVLYEACRQAAKWQHSGQPLKVSVNVAAPQLTHPNFIAMVVDALERYNLDAKYLELEITESAVMKDIYLVAERLVELRELGVSIALDDFGVGFSSLKYLQKLSFNKLKIDRTFVSNIDNIDNNFYNRSIIEMIVQLAKKLNLNTVAEGVETPEQADYLKSLSCECVQGFYYAKPTTADKVFDFTEEAIRKITQYNIKLGY